jgi:predicted metalloprotease
VTFNSGAQLDPDQVTDVRGRSYGGGRGIAVGGGGIGLVIAVVYLLLGGNPADLAPAGGGAANGPIGSQATQECKSGDQANARADCRIVGFVDSIQRYWKDEFTREGETYQPAQTIIFSDAVDTGCGPATTQVGPFYCPPDVTVYIDLGFDELQSRFGAKGGSLAEGTSSPTIGHHIQDLEGSCRAAAAPAPTAAASGRS